MDDERRLSKEKTMEKKGRAWLKWVLPLVIILAGFLVMRVMIHLKRAPERTSAAERGQLVETVSVARAEGRVRIETQGTVVPFQQMDVVPRVSGYVTADHLEVGKSFAAGEILFTIDDEDYRLAAVKAESQVAQAVLALAEVRSKARSAKLEWERMPGREGMSPSPLLLYEPQLASAKAQLEGAKADLAARRLDIKRCTVKAPFACRVLGETVAPGQFVSQGMKVATLLASDRMDVVVPVTAEELAWVDPEQDEVRVSLKSGEKTVTRTGRLVRRLADVDPDGRMARLLVRVKEPFNDEVAAVVPEMYVGVELVGRPIDSGFSVPLEALVDGKWVYVLTPDNTLSVREVSVVWRRKARAIVTGPLAEGELAITSGVAGAAPGMKLRQWNAAP
ncbi:efflux RND transporter periplasmic adaptor subunit [Desulfoluna spongiiphila]|uniref:RND family efflux transporter, MFP subunit n=1 Tax=Desulfoluna spongiiphila TaxID=419481 RepID=A0A1G5BTZ4_9BACT|nr:efflux RND transporter periplasmic adaptor subunit [Desulfoluna spongiiphila]SCX93583.1 RND family efflux transporter, MFP subunit [Desulfoluna spongiiphila]